MEDMDALLAQTLVWGALHKVLTYPYPIEDEHLTLEEIGLTTDAHRHHFRAELVSRIVGMGYGINPNDVPNGARDTPLIIAAILPGKVTKGNTI